MPLYLHLNGAHADYAAAITDCETQHETTKPGTQLSVNYSDHFNEAVVKINGVGGSWHTTKPWAGAVIAVLSDTGRKTVTSQANWAPDDPEI